MIYLDTSVALAEVFGEQQRVPKWVWDQQLVSSRLLQYELWVRLQARKAGIAAIDIASDLLTGVSLLEMSPLVLARALEPFPTPVRTLDALHLATMDFLRSRNIKIKLLSFDVRLLEAAQALGIDVVE